VAPVQVALTIVTDVAESVAIAEFAPPAALVVPVVPVPVVPAVPVVPGVLGVVLVVEPEREPDVLSSSERRPVMRT